MPLLHYASSRCGMPFAKECRSHKRVPTLSCSQPTRFIALENEIIGKPVDLREAAQILQRLSGRIHEVCSAVLIYHQTSGRSAVFHDISRVRFHRLNGAMIKEYVAKVDPLDKAGAYAAQGSGAEIIAKIEGSFTNVVGLPIEKTIASLARFGIRPKA
jgi:septum formation protein